MVNMKRFSESNGEGTDKELGNSLPDTNDFVEFPFKSGDKLSFLIKVDCDLYSQRLNVNKSDTWESSEVSSLNDVFKNIDGVIYSDDKLKLLPEVWKFTFVI